MRAVVIVLGAAVALAGASSVEAQSGEDIYASPESMAAFEKSLRPQHGRVTLLDGDVVLDVPDTLYFLDEADAERVIVDAWGNPDAAGTLGMLFAEGATPLDADVWGLEISWDGTGYVSDDDAATIDYDELLRDLQAATRTESEARQREGYGSVELIGWAASPRYDSAGHKLYWARELNFDDAPVNTLNYNIRVLGREGVLVMNFIAGIDQLAEIETVAPNVLEVASFAEGKRYEDFNPTTDRAAGYGLAGLIAGGLGVAALKKTGLLAIALVFLKKGWVLLAAGGAALLGAIRKLFGGRKAS
jgi:uncharacterized membrane-anchored protein